MKLGVALIGHWSPCPLHNTELSETELTGKVTAKCPTEVGVLLIWAEWLLESARPELMTYWLLRSRRAIYIRESSDQFSSVAY